MNLTPKHNLEEFNQFLFGQIDLQLFKYKFLRDFIDKAKNGQSVLYDLSVINKTENGWILIIHSEMLLVYGENWTKEQFKEISEVFDLNKYTNYTLAGETELIDNLLAFYQPKNSVTEKRRLFYQTEFVKAFDTKDFRIKNAEPPQLNELSLMLQEYYHEEYNGLNDKEFEDMQNRMSSMIGNKTVYVLLNEENAIISFCTIIDPDIGILFTKNEYRNNGYGKMILSYCSGLLQRKNSIVFLMTDKDKPESNQVCREVGFEPYFKYNMVKINCG